MADVGCVSVCWNELYQSTLPLNSLSETLEHTANPF